MLADLAVAEVAEGEPSIAERLGQWLDFTDSIALSGALNASLASVPPGDAAAAGAALREDFTRVRTYLADSIRNDGVINPGPARVKLPLPAPDAPVDGAADFDPYHRYYLAHQRDMGASIGPLRVNARAALAASSPSLKRLADLDAVLDQALAARERNLLATVPLLLAKRFARLYEGHRAGREGAAADDPAQWMQLGGWLAAFCRDLQTVLLAELELRLQPVAGLIEALSNEETKQQ